MERRFLRSTWAFLIPVVLDLFPAGVARGLPPRSASGAAAHLARSSPPPVAAVRQGRRPWAMYGVLGLPKVSQKGLISALAGAFTSYRFRTKMARVRQVVQLTGVPDGIKLRTFGLKPSLLPPGPTLAFRTGENSALGSDSAFAIRAKIWLIAFR